MPVRPPTDAFARRWDEYRTLRRAWVGAVTGSLVAGLLAWVVVRSAGTDRLGTALAIPFVVNAVGCWCLAIASSLSLMAFRCPRCVKLFTVSLLSSGPANRCKHCGVRVGTRSDAPPAWTRFRIA